MKLSTHLNFNGNCRAAFEYYEKHLGGKITFIMTYGESPMADHVAPESHGRIVHATLELPGNQRVSGADMPAGRPFDKPQGFEVLLTLEDPADAERIFAALADEGETQMPLQKTFWSERFGMLTDRFGTPWMVNCRGLV